MATSTRIALYDTTLRDGSQGENVNFSVTDKVLIARRLDAFGIDYIEGGWPGSNPKDIEFFAQMEAQPLRHAKLAAFGSTRHARHAVEDDPNLQKLLEARTPVVTIFGKSWLLHVKEALRVSPETNVHMVAESVRYLVAHGREVIFDAEHFFDGYCDDAGYALEVLQAAREAGAQCLVLCDTNGGTLPHDVRRIVADVCRRVRGVAIGFHGHNDAGCGVADALMAVQAGATHIQGTINGIGERCGNADLTGIIPALMLKMRLRTNVRLEDLTEVSRYVDELANLLPNKRQPYVGQSAFAHKAGIHVSAIQRNPRTYEHVDPALVGNQRRVLVSELSGQSNVLFKAKELRLDLGSDPEQARRVVEEVKRREHEGYEYEAADASFELLVKKALGVFTPSFEVLGFRCIDEERNGTVVSEATIKVRVGGREEHTAAEGDGPVHALDTALRKALRPFFPCLEEIELIDYKVRVLTAKGLTGTASKVRVLVETRDQRGVWGTVGVSTNIIEASYEALVDSIEYKLMRDKHAKKKT
ncbi:MAG: citramalate synthase [bacterium]|nr:citramalate synthase [bacterium]